MILQLEKIRERSLPRASPPAGDVAHEHPRGVGRRSIPGTASRAASGAAGRRSRRDGWSPLQRAVWAL